MTDKEKYIQFVDVLCKMLGFNKPRDILKMCEVISDFTESYEVRIKKLEQENAELKKQQFSLRNERNTFLTQNEQYEKDLIDFNENLTKAKEIIKDLLRVLPKENIKGVYEITEEAEQFIRKNT